MASTLTEPRARCPAALAASDATKKDMSSEFLVGAMTLFPKLEDANARAAGSAATAGIPFAAAADAWWGAQVLNEGVT